MRVPQAGLAKNQPCQAGVWVDRMSGARQRATRGGGRVAAQPSLLSQHVPSTTARGSRVLSGMMRRWTTPSLSTTTKAGSLASRPCRTPRHETDADERFALRRLCSTAYLSAGRPSDTACAGLLQGLPGSTRTDFGLPPTRDDTSSDASKTSNVGPNASWLRIRTETVRRGGRRRVRGLQCPRPGRGQAHRKAGLP